MALGGGEFVQMDKVLPGVYINFKSTSTASLSAERGVATIPLILDWGDDEGIIEITSSNFVEKSQVFLGYDYLTDNANVTPVREVLKNATKLYVYRLNNNGQKASNMFGEAKYSGTRGNDLKITITANIDNLDEYIVSTLLDNNMVDTQTITEYSELVGNDYINFNTDATLESVLALPLIGGTNGTVNLYSHQLYLEEIEKYSFNIIGVATTNSTLKNLYANFVKRMRTEYGSKFQLALHNFAGDNEGIVNIKNNVAIEKRFNLPILEE